MVYNTMHMKWVILVFE